MTTIREHAQEFDGKWVGNDRFPVKTGDVGFLLELTSYARTPRGTKRLDLRLHPAQDSETFEGFLYGFIQGSRTDLEALGLAEVYDATPNGRGRVKAIFGDQASLALERLGYPDLIPQLQDAENEWTA
jgi:hypothetical protein